MYVLKRDGRKESVKFDKVTARIKKLSYGLDPRVDPVEVAMKVIEGIYEGVTTSELDNLAAEVAASTSQILGNNECIEPYTSNIYTRRVLSGEFVVVNKHLLKDRVKLGLWNDDLKNKIIAANGSIQELG